MIEVTNRTFRLLAALALSVPLACSVNADGQIPCADDSSCPADYPVCSAGKCAAGTSTSTNSVAIVGVQGHNPGDLLRGTVTLSVTAKANSGIKSIALTAGTKTYTPNTSSVPPLFLFDVVTRDAATSAGDVDVTATPPAGDDSTVTTPKFTIHIDNGAPTLTVALVGASNVGDGTLVKFDVTPSKAVASVT